MKKVLLISLGTSPLIIPEAVLAMEGMPAEVHVFTTHQKGIELIADQTFKIFEEHFPGISFSFTVAEGISLINDAVSQQRYDEALFHWYLEKADSKLPYVCLSGGTKTMPAAMQQATRYFGAEEVFHVLIDLPPEKNPRTFEEVRICVQDNLLKVVKLGYEPGWKSMRNILSPTFFSPTHNHPEYPFLFFKKYDTQFRISNGVRHIMQSIRLAAAGEESEIPPFSLLRLLPPETAAWIREPLNGEADKNWIMSLPKIDLHCHLGGFATHPPLLDEVRSAATNVKLHEPIPQYPEGWPLPENPVSLEQYMRLGDANGSALLKDPACLKRQVELLYEYLLNENIRYVEIRCSPDNYSSEHRRSWQILEDIRSVFQFQMDKQRKQFPEKFCHVNLVIIATRRKEGDLSGISRHLALAVTSSARSNVNKLECSVVGVDLAGFENRETRPEYFASDFIGIHRNGIAVTAHAGENDDAESIWQAVHQLHARRIGHGLNLWQAPDLMRTMTERRIGVEMCPYANYQIKGFAPMKGITDNYRLLDYLEYGLPVTVNTDNVGISGAGLTDNFLLLARLNPGITRWQVLTLIKNSIETAFCPVSHKKELLKVFDQQIFEACTSQQFK